ncbi:dipeptidase [Yinghuangia seranimata]|uniref:dipeptidase n=1 Tax=Yinghuangia seranimata TaxID=408067 RepID=UPI00248C18D1|nr:dipeptidase [Yinghuangia seranimata]MDI2127643.1 dipeptidase [Yinghuangia seranimata]
MTSQATSAAGTDGAGSDLARRVAGLMPRAKQDLATLVGFRSVADPRQFPPEECEKAARFVADAFRELGFADARPEKTPDDSYAVVGHRPGPPGAPTVLLYCHYDVQPPLDDAAWTTPPFELTERDGRWYGRGAADCKGNIAMHLTALRALGDDIPVSLRLVAEGSEEQGTGGLDEFVPRHPELLRADAILVCDTGNAAVGVPTLTTTLRGVANVVVEVRALKSEVHSGMFGGPAPDALAALITMLASLRDENGATAIDGLAHDQVWDGEAYDADQFRADAGVLDGVSLVGGGAVADLVWARPAVTVLGIDCPPVVGSTAAVPAVARARVSLRVPPGTDPEQALAKLTDHLKAHAPWGVRLEFTPEQSGSPFKAEMGGPAYQALSEALSEAYGRPMTTVGQGGSIPLCTILRDTFPDAEIALMGVEEPKCLIHAPNESVDPAEIEHMALAEALFLRKYAAAKS